MEIRKYVEEGQERIRKGLFEGNSLVGPNWANHENLSILGQGTDEAESNLISNLKKEGPTYYRNNLDLQNYRLENELKQAIDPYSQKAKGRRAQEAAEKTNAFGNDTQESD